MATLEAVQHTRIVERGGEVILRIELPHEDERSFDLEIDDHELRVTARDLDETIELPDSVDPWQLRIACADDTLEIRAHKPTRVLLDPESTPC